MAAAKQQEAASESRWYQKATSFVQRPGLRRMVLQAVRGIIEVQDLEQVTRHLEKCGLKQLTKGSCAPLAHPLDTLDI
jgi:hypothetical protein